MRMPVFRKNSFRVKDYVHNTVMAFFSLPVREEEFEAIRMSAYAPAMAVSKQADYRLQLITNKPSLLYQRQQLLDQRNRHRQMAGVLN